MWLMLLYEPLMFPKAPAIFAMDPCGGGGSSSSVWSLSLEGSSPGLARPFSFSFFFSSCSSSCMERMISSCSSVSRSRRELVIGSGWLLVVQ